MAAVGNMLLTACSVSPQVVSKKPLYNIIVKKHFLKLKKKQAGRNSKDGKVLITLMMLLPLFITGGSLII
jgi:hypothetical protein